MNHNQSDQSQTKESLKNDNLEKPDNPKNDIKKETDVKGVLVLVNKEHSLPADYIPENLVKPNIPFSFKEDLPKKLMRKEAAQAIENLFKKAKEDNFNLVGVSAYRSYHRQKQIFDYKARKLGKEVANKTSAYPGQSEHQTGLAIDISSPNMGYRLHQAFGNTPEGIWLAKNAPNFGFIIRYPNGKEEITGYVYEPWHLRYVGIKVAQEITQKNITFEERMRDFS
ncbi:MAG: M15 family metallopeptidase [Halanaerobiales bacterium]|nr:M15 family metallopeptidase [Halanaerobiales bacterium]